MRCRWRQFQKPRERGEFMTRIYIAGPMSGRQDLNFPAFHAEAARLRELGHTVLNPAENPQPDCNSWEGYMRMAVAQLVTCDAIYLLPGWAESRGALIERRLAQELRMHVIPAGGLSCA
jgi:hypothetical protein